MKSKAIRKLDTPKYKGLIISIVLFIILDLSILGINFILSYNISKDAQRITLASNQKVLTERLTKDLFQFQSAHRFYEPFAKPMQEIESTIKQFDATLYAFENGGEVTTIDNKKIIISALKNKKAKIAIKNTKPIWAIYKNNSSALINEFKNKPVIKESIFATFEEEALFKTATNYASANHEKMINEMRDLTKALESDAGKLAATLRTILAIGLVLALINFLFIMFHTLRQLQDRDEKVRKKTRQTNRILNTVEEGLFLLDSNLKTGDRYSAAMNTLFPGKMIANQPFMHLLSNAVNKEDVTNAKEYIELLFDESKSNGLLLDINPLKNIGVYTKNSDGDSELKFLKFSFKPILKNNIVDRIFVSVSDITKPAILKKRLDDERNRGEQRMKIMTDIFTIDKNILTEFVSNSLVRLEGINDLLKKDHNNDINYFDSILPIIDVIHTEATAFELNSFATMANELKGTLMSLKVKSKITGKDFIPFTVLLDQMISNIEAACQLPELKIHKEISKQKHLSLYRSQLHQSL